MPGGVAVNPCVEEEIMSKSETMTTETGTAGEPDALTDKDLDAVTGAGVATFQLATGGVLSTNGGVIPTGNFPTETVKMTYGAIEWTY
jgi:hypothetical protein